MRWQSRGQLGQGVPQDQDRRRQLHGAWPVRRVDHRNQDKLDNRLSNLREATTVQNNQNISSPNRGNVSGFRGVSPSRERWIAVIRADGKQRYLGIHDTPEAAFATYVAAKRELHPFWSEEAV